ncbi:hypothetical protein DK058_26405, partial [Salmonella enterica subsp. enterica serovar Typhi]|nr:hypothetical protein [Salmonella enterica subsp. enterica serovar Typhi]
MGGTAVLGAPGFVTEAQAEPGFTCGAYNGPIDWQNESPVADVLYGTACGQLTRANAEGGTAYGHAATANQAYSTAVGAFSTADGFGALAIGARANAYSWLSSAAGYEARAGYSASAFGAN